MSAPSALPALRYGMVGGGPGAFIGSVHRQAIALDGTAGLAAGAFSSNPERSFRQGAELGLDPNRVYGSFPEMAAAEAALPEEDRIDFVAIVTPNHLHYEVARSFLDAGFHVVCDKPMTTTLADAEALCRQVRGSGRVFALTHNYTGYPMVKEARALTRAGRLGTVRKVVVEYSQGWLATLLEAEGQKQAVWRTDPDLAGAGALGDIGSHAHNLVRYITGLEIEALCADVSTLVPGRRVEDDANILIHYQGGARGVLICSQISVGEENHLHVRVYGDQAALEWAQESPNALTLTPAEGPAQTLTRGMAGLSPAAERAARLPGGHPEGFIEAFANIYRNAAEVMVARGVGTDPDPLATDYPTAQDGAVGVHFIEAALASGRTRGWVDVSYLPPS